MKQKSTTNYQLVSPGDHRDNPAERAIKTFKAHFISILSGTDTNYPATDWDLLIPQAVQTLNFLQRSRLNQKYPPTHSSMDNSTSMPPHWHQRAAKLSSMTGRATEGHGKNGAHPDTIQAQQWPTIETTRAISQAPKNHAFPTPWNSSPHAVNSRKHHQLTDSTSYSMKSATPYRTPDQRDLHSPRVPRTRTLTTSYKKLEKSSPPV